MKLIFCGKGGCGKSTLSTLFAREFAARGKRVVVIDTDESNYGLYRQLGVKQPEDFTHYYGGRKEVMDIKNSEAPLFEKKWHLDDIPERFLSGEGNLRLMSMGKIVDAGEGCGCPMGFLARGFADNLELDENDVLLVDAEAGVEHFGRGLDQFMDAIVMVVDPSYESIQLSGKIGHMARQLGKPIYFVLNRVDEAQGEQIRQTMEHPEEILAQVPMSNQVLSAGLKGERLDCPMEEISRAVDTLLA